MSHLDISNVGLSIKSDYLLQIQRNGNVILASYDVTNMT